MVSEILRTVHQGKNYTFVFSNFRYYFILKLSPTPIDFLGSAEHQGLHGI